MKKKVLGVVLATCLLVVVFTGCSEADRVSENVSKEASAFKEYISSRLETRDLSAVYS